MPLFSRFFHKNPRKRSTEAPDTGILQGASNIAMSNPVMMDRPTIIQAFMDGQTVLQMLAAKMTPGADVDSSERYPPPQCHPGTREWLTKRIYEWLMNESRERDLLWFRGAAGVGKSAVAQTVAEYAADHGRLGAAFFFSESGGRIDHARVWITIAYQLAVRIPHYQALVAKELAADPDILNKAPPVLFKRLIANPLSSLPPSHKFLIVLDGLDECKTEDAQLNIIDLISSAVQSMPSLPVVWMVCSRPEYHIKQRFFDNDFPIDCWKMELPIDTKEAKEDVALFIRSSFKNIRKKYSDIVSESWPPEEDLREIMEAVSGLFAAASTVVRYVDDPEHKNPRARLQRILQYLRGPGPAYKENPMAKLDQLYTKILSEIPSDILPITIQLIYLSHMSAIYSTPTAIIIANFLGISREEFYRALRKLHSVLDIPSPQDALMEPVKFLHKSFTDYLDNPDRSGHFHRTRGDVVRDVLNHFSRLASSTSLLSCGNMEKPPDLPLTWRPSDPGNETILKRGLCLYCTKDILLAFSLIPASGAQHALDAMRNLDYNFFVGIQRSIAPIESTTQATQNVALYHYVQENKHQLNILYTEPKHDTARNLLEGLQAQFPNALPIPNLSYGQIPYEVDPPYYFFLGQDTKSILGVCRGLLKIKFYSTRFPFGSE